MAEARTLRIGLSLTPSGPDGPGKEVAAAEYQRQAMLFEPAADAPTLLANLVTTEWPRAARLWGDVGWLSGWELNGAYAGYGSVVSVTDETTPAVVRVDRGDVARFRAGTLVLSPIQRVPSLYGRGPYGAGLYARAYRQAIAGALREAFAPAGSACPDDATWAAIADVVAAAFAPSGSACSGAAWTTIAAAMRAAFVPSGSACPDLATWAALAEDARDAFLPDAGTGSAGVWRPLADPAHPAFLPSASLCPAAAWVAA
jgi:hypothetical protein